jgi:tetratricopeptide (TPR) repeat protein
VSGLPVDSRHCAVCLAAVCLSILVASGCASPTRAPMRISQITHQGDTRRQASVRLVVEGLDAELAASSDRALSRYQRAIQIDPGNPFAYLALARYYVSVDDPTRALEYLDRVQSLLDSNGSFSLRTSPHLLGLRGNALEQMGRDAEAAQLLAQARRLAPSAWGDGRLDAVELR